MSTSFSTLKFVESNKYYSTWLDRDDEQVYLSSGPNPVRLVHLDEIEIEDLHFEWETLGWNEQRRFGSDFLTWAETKVTYPHEVREQFFICDDCSEVEHQEDSYCVNGDSLVCESCRDNNYYHCDSCEELKNTSNSTLGDDCVCDNCLNNCYSWCEDCDGYYHGDDSGDHEHGGCQCEAPGMNFLVPNNGNGVLANDTSTTVTLPSGVISDEGVRSVTNLLLREASRLGDEIDYMVDYNDPIRLPSQNMRHLAYRIEEVGPEWQTKDGNFTKRVSRFAYKNFKTKLSPQIISEIGNIGSAHSQSVDVTIQVTRDLNLSPEEFAHEESCWWQSYSSSRCALKNNGGFGLRSFEKGHYGDEVSGRAWVMPLKNGVLRSYGGREQASLVATTNTETPDAYVVFNGYGEINGYKCARIVAHMAGMTYRKIGLTAEPMYINGDSAYLIAPEEIAEDYTDGSLTLRVPEHNDLFQTERVEEIAALVASVKENAHV